VMETFSAVVTTGIYCRPGCAAKPRPDHVREFEFAAAAEAAGYRACLRCRPYRTPETTRWEGPELVCRAVQLIIAGALDDGSEVELGARLGVSARHLRRLFNDHLGATPDQLARSRRAHFARRLLDDTDLRVADIAFASGFGSIRQLHRACREVFRSTPLALRARRRASDRLAADGGLTLRLPFRATLDWYTMLDYFAVRAIAGVEHVSERTYRRTIVVDGDPGVLEFAPGGADHMVIRAHLPHWEGLIHVVERARRIFGLDADLESAARDLENDPTIGSLLRDRPGLRVPGTWDPFETGVRAIVGQQVTVAGASTLIARLVERHGTPVAGLGPLGLTHTFPPASVLAGAELDGIGLTASRARAVRDFACAVADDTIRLDQSVELGHLISSITAIPGLGPWTAHYVALRLGERDAFPAADLDLRRALAQDEPLSTRELTTLAESWRPWRALAATHLWMRPRSATATS
jgi:AraC family transcriptional regulator of adaptative response / DNA-3-methyladenine glycosylase II